MKTDLFILWALLSFPNLLALWKISYNKPRRYIKNQSHYFADKGPYSQNYGFSGGHGWM